jgi:threonine aldolase
MANAPVGDDVYGNDPTVSELEALAADLTGKEAGLFVASGTMGNQLAVMTHTRRGDEILCDAECHIVQHEVGAAAVLSGVTVRCVPSERGRMDPHAVRAAVRAQDIHYPPTTLLCLENAHSLGAAVPLAYLAEMRGIADEHGLRVHMDGARLFNAAHALGCTPREIAGYADSVTFCLSKGLCAPVGSVLCGPADFVARARKNRKLLGGGMRQAGILAAAGLIALREMTARLGEDHRLARLFEELLGEIPGVAVQTGDVNLVFFRVPPRQNAALYAAMMGNGFLCNPGEPDGTWRFATHRWVSEPEVRDAAAAVRDVVLQ